MKYNMAAYKPRTASISRIMIIHVPIAYAVCASHKRRKINAIRAGVSVRIIQNLMSALSIITLLRGETGLVFL